MSKHEQEHMLEESKKEMELRMLARKLKGWIRSAPTIGGLFGFIKHMKSFLSCRMQN
jgi:hypothetical protein